MEQSRGSKCREIYKEEMTVEGYEKLAALLPKAQKQLQRRVKFLRKWGKEDYLSALQKLSQWEKELIVNTKHQQNQLYFIHNYGELLSALCSYRRAMIYSERRVKQVQLDRAVEGHRWKSCEFLIYKEKTNRKILYESYFMINKLEDCLLHGQKLLDTYISTNVQKSDEIYSDLLYDLYCAYVQLDKEKQGQDVKEQLMQILRQKELYDTFQYQQMMKKEERQQEQIMREKLRKKQNKIIKEHIQEEKQQKHDQKDGEDEQKEKQEERKKMEERARRIRKAKQELEYIRLYSLGKYSTRYLVLQGDLIDLLYRWDQWRMVIEEGIHYLEIRKQTPYLEYRPDTCWVFRYMMKSCSETGHREKFYCTSAELASFIPRVICKINEFDLVYECIYSCACQKWQRASRPVIISLINSTLQLELQQSSLHRLMYFGYYVLLMSVTEQTVVNKFLHWMDMLYKQQQFTQTWHYENIVETAISFNDLPSDDLFVSRNKDYWDSKFIQIVPQLLQNQSGKFEFNPFRWQNRMTPLIPFHHPSHSFLQIINSIEQGIKKQLMERQESVLLVFYFEQFRKTHCNSLNLHQTQFYVRHVYIFSRLHLSDWHLHCLPSLFDFAQLLDMEALTVSQAESMGIDSETCIQNALDQKILKMGKLWKDQIYSWKREFMKEGGNQAQLRARKVYARYQHYRLCTSKRRRRLCLHNKFLLQSRDNIQSNNHFLQFPISNTF